MVFEPLACARAGGRPQSLNGTPLRRRRASGCLRPVLFGRPLRPRRLSAAPHSSSNVVQSALDEPLRWSSEFVFSLIPTPLSPDHSDSTKCSRPGTSIIPFIISATLLRKTNGQLPSRPGRERRGRTPQLFPQETGQIDQAICRSWCAPSSADAPSRLRRI
jgi:hypothetical protein